MVKLVIFFEPPDDIQAFEASWQTFLRQAEKMPGLRKETVGRVERFLYGSHSVFQIHEFYFDSIKEAEEAMASPQGVEAGKLLQAMTGGRVTLLFADHKEDDLEHIRRHTQMHDVP